MLGAIFCTETKLDSEKSTWDPLKGFKGSRGTFENYNLGIPAPHKELQQQKLEKRGFREAPPEPSFQGVGRRVTRLQKFPTVGSDPKPQKTPLQTFDFGRVNFQSDPTTGVDATPPEIPKKPKRCVNRPKMATI